MKVEKYWYGMGWERDLKNYKKVCSGQRRELTVDNVWIPKEFVFPAYLAIIMLNHMKLPSL